MNIQKKLALIFNLEPGEGRQVGLLFMLYFFLGAAYSFTQAAAFPIFLLTFSARALPWVYMTNAVVVVLITYVYLRLSSRLSFARLLAGNITFLFLVIAAFRLGLGIRSNEWVIFGLPVLFQVLINFGNLAFWSLAGRLLNVQQAKRIFGLIGGGQWAAIVLTGFLIPLLVRWIGAANLLILAAGSVACVFAVLYAVTRAYSGQLGTLEAPSKYPAPRAAARTSLSRYVLWIFGLVIFWWIAYYFIDNIFYGQLAVQYPAEDELASFMGFYLAGQAITILLINTFLTGPVINRFGVRIGLLVLPAGLLAITASSAVFGTLSGALGLLFTLAVLSKLVNMGLGFSIDLSAQNIMYQPLPLQERARTKTMADGVVQPLANGLAGLALLLLTSVLALDMVQLSYLLLLFVGGWLGVVYLLNREYPIMLRKALARRQLKGADLTSTDETSVSILVRELQNPHPGVVLYAFEALETAAPAMLHSVVHALLEHPSAEVRRAALACVERHSLAPAQAAVHELLQKEPDPTNYGMALRTLAALRGSAAVEPLVKFVRDPDPNIQKGAIVGLVRYGGIPGVLAAGGQLLEMAQASNPDERSSAAEIIRDLEVSGFCDPLIDLLGDEVHAVRRAAIQAATQVKFPRLIPPVIEALRDPALRGPAAAALSAWGSPALPDLIAAAEKPDKDTEHRVAMIEAIGSIGGQEALSWLKQRIADSSAPVRSVVLQALSRGGYRARDAEIAMIQAQIRSEVVLAAEVLAVRAGLGENGRPGLFGDLLSETFDQAQARIFDLLTFLYNPDAIRDARANLALLQDNRRAYALEILDVVVAQPVKSWVSPLWAEGPARLKLPRLADHFPVPEIDLAHGIRTVLSAPEGRYSLCCRAAALHTIGVRAVTAMADEARQALTSPYPLLRETAAWALSRLEAAPAGLHPYPGPEDPGPGTFGVKAALARQERAKGVSRMLTTLEKVIAIKQASIFAGLPNEILAAVAPLLEEIWLDEGTQVFEKGELGDSMYVIVQGMVRVHDGDLTLNDLEAGDVFGEMAVLDSEPRVASVTAVAETCLLCLAQEPFYALLEAQPAVAQGLIRTLSSHLRARIRDLNVLKTGAAALN